MKLLEVTHECRVKYNALPKIDTIKVYSYVIFFTCSDHSVHDRKISVLGFCSLLQCPDKPAPVHNLASKVVPAIVAQLEGLIEAYKSKHILYNGKFWQPLNLAKRSESAMYIIWRLNFGKFRIALPRTCAYITRCETVGYYILLVNLKFGVIAKSPN